MDNRTFRRLDLSALGLTPGEARSDYLCAPKGARVLGWTGVDGIHFCTLRDFGEMVFAVSPANLPGDCVHPVARNLEDFLGLLLTCGADALEQAHGWDRTAFDAFRAEYPPSEAAQAAAERLKGKGTEIADPYGYLRQLQASFDYGSLPWKRDYLAVLKEAEQEKAEEEQESERPWEVTYQSGFWGKPGRERPGRELPINRLFHWGGDTWLVPAVYLCGKGLVVDLCLRAEAADIQAFSDRWGLWEDPEGQHFTQEQREIIEAENPLNREFHAKADVNGRLLNFDHSCSVGWLPWLPEGVENNPEARRVMAHYGLDREAGWHIHRLSFLWPGKCPSTLSRLILHLSAAKVMVPGPHFKTPEPGTKIVFEHPITKESHTLTAEERENQTLSSEMFPDDGMERPRCCQVLTYTMEPDLQEPAFFLRDCCEGDPVRPQKGYGPTAYNGVAFAVIGGADGPTAILAGRRQKKLHTACSSLYFTPPERVEWRLGFYQKPREDVAVALLPEEETT